MTKTQNHEVQMEITFTCTVTVQGAKTGNEAIKIAKNSFGVVSPSISIADTRIIDYEVGNIGQKNIVAVTFLDNDKENSND